MVDAQFNLLSAIDELTSSETPTQIRTINEVTGEEDAVDGKDSLRFLN